jgi:amidophosphoribosyltransferase
VGRTFIEPHQSIRNFGVKVKLNPVRSGFEGRVVLIDDPIDEALGQRKLFEKPNSG